MFFTTEGLTVHNITELGGEATGPQSVFYIDPLPGYNIFAGQFSIEQPSVSDPYSSVTFQDTVFPSAVNNRVEVKVNWDGVTPITQDYILNLNILYDGGAIPTSSVVTDISYTFTPNVSYNGVSISSQPLDIVETLNHQVNSSSSGSYDVSCSVIQGSTSLVGQFLISIDSPSTRFFDQELTASATGGSNTNGGGFNPSFSYEYETASNAFGDTESVVVKVFYTSQQDVSSDNEAVVTANVTQPVDYYFRFVNAQGQSSTALQVDENATTVNLLYQTNIPSPSTNITPQVVNSQLLTVGLMTDQGISVDISALPQGFNDRQGAITIQDIHYSNSDFGDYDFKEIEQVASEFAYVLVSEDIITGGWNYTTSNCKVVSTPNTSLGDNQYAFNLGGQTNSYDTPFVGSIKYSVQVRTNIDVTQSEVESGFSITQTQVPINPPATVPVDWVDIEGDGGPDFSWTNLENGYWVRSFYIRNNWSNSDRTATLTFTHPDDANATDSITITQDALYLDTVDTVSLKAAWTSETSSGSSAYGDAESAINDGSYTTATIKIKLSDFENDFNMPNSTNEDPNDSEYKQYGKPRVEYVHSGELFNDDLFIEGSSNTPYDEFFLVNEVVANSSYDANDPNNDHQYELSVSVQSNTTPDSRFVTFRVFHPQNIGVEQDAWVRLRQGADTAMSIMYINGNNNQPGQFQGNPVENFGYSVTYNYEAADPNLTYPFYQLWYNGSTPTIGLWDGSSYTALNSGVSSSNGLSYTAIQESPNVLAQSTTGDFKVLFTENGPTARSEQLAIWHSSLTPASDFPSAILQFSQNALPFDPQVNNVYFTGGQPSAISPDGQTLTYQVKVSDYTTEDFNNDTNQPIVDVQRVTSSSFPAGGAFIISDIDNVIGSITISKNLNWTLGSQDHSHSVEVVYGSNNSTQHFAVRLAHSLNSMGTYQNTFVSSTLPLPNIAFPTNRPMFNGLSSVTAISSEEVTFANISDDPTSPYIHPSFTIQNPNTYFNEPYLYYYPNDYIFARYIDDSNEVQSNSNGIFQEDTTNIIPRGNTGASWLSSSNAQFTQNNTGAQYNLGESGITATLLGNDEVYLANPGIGFGYAGDLWPNFQINQNEGLDRSTKIGFWSGYSAPKTNLIDTSQSPQPTITYSGLYQNFQTAEFAAQAIAAYTATADGFTWDPNFYGVMLSENAINANDYIVIELDIDAVVSSDKEYGIKFNIENLEYLGGWDMDVGLHTGWYQSPSESPYSTVQLNYYLLTSENGSFAARITGLESGSSTKLKFRVRRNSKLTVSNLVFWDIENDASIATGQDVSANQPDCVMNITQESAAYNPMYFGTESPLGSEYNGLYAINSVQQNLYVGSDTPDITYTVTNLPGQPTTLNIYDEAGTASDYRLAWWIFDSSSDTGNIADDMYFTPGAALFDMADDSPIYLGSEGRFAAPGPWTITNRPGVRFAFIKPWDGGSTNTAKNISVRFYETFEIGAAGGNIPTVVPPAVLEYRIVLHPVGTPPPNN
ncbi:hypothetical protein N9D80_01385 [Flavobacteriales bacterium]|nr:hypothetical protein [Flavobacteriales bacterium]